MAGNPPSHNASRCGDCRRRVNLFYRSYAAIEDEPTCPRCGGTSLSRLISRVAVVRSEESRLDDLTDPSMLADLDEEGVAALVERAFRSHWQQRYFHGGVPDPEVLARGFYLSAPDMEELALLTRAGNEVEMSAL